jgi:anti-sigma factor RsiW
MTEMKKDISHILLFEDEELSQEEKRDLELLLQKSPDAQESLTDWVNCRLALSSIVVPQASEEFVQSVMKRINALEQRRHSWSSFMEFFSLDWMASAAVLSLCVFALIHTGGLGVQLESRDVREVNLSQIDSSLEELVTVFGEIDEHVVLNADDILKELAL